MYQKDVIKLDKAQSQKNVLTKGFSKKRNLLQYKSQRGGADYFKQPETQTGEDINPIPVNPSYIRAKSWLKHRHSDRVCR